MRKTYIALLGLLIIAASALGYRYVENLDHPEIRISSNPWVGFTPFIYAQEKGWLKNTPFRFLWLVDLSENRRLYENGFVQGFTATQYELLHFAHPDALETVFLTDRSNGADAILSNRTLAALQAESKPIKVYLERDSLQRDMFHAFINENGLKDHAFELTNRAQEMMLLLKPGPAPMLVLSYSPYLTQLHQHGFQTIASTRSLKSFIVVDGLFVNRQVYAKNRADFVKLKEIFDRALAVFHSDPKTFYDSVKGYLEGQTFDQFMASTRDIVWLDQQVDPEMLKYMKRQGVRVDERIP
ncbi:lipoprotein [Halothiobacillus neapolitanus]|uniref:Putative lipoprotein n=1 Tax=Halothiobacillus neapolitanus (strain ATCC 23641 / DSM 15147 / CIP 104769 / NCIMB 8539 / c2) TaxID=555778 RepID=D0L1R7_HALNC|nr:lipoprotein [Halothiobacillus neapolitanus]ACX96640.1 putative lipoprotein [Halothiobacillus neapolitanus c2]TDN65250.1 NitT/TauT family transport system substrate-binding protein [Halothiobacillus neapolitanus]